MKNNMSNDEKLRRSAKAIAYLLTGLIVIGALILFFTQIKNDDLFLGAVVPAISLSFLPIIWILYYLILTICDIENHIFILNENFVKFAKNIMKQKNNKEKQSNETNSE